MKFLGMHAYSHVIPKDHKTNKKIDQCKQLSLLQILLSTSSILLYDKYY